MYIWHNDESFKSAKSKVRALIQVMNKGTNINLRNISNTCYLGKIASGSKRGNKS